MMHVPLQQLRRKQADRDEIINMKSKIPLNRSGDARRFRDGIVAFQMDGFHARVLLNPIQNQISVVIFGYVHLIPGDVKWRSSFKFRICWSRRRSQPRRKILRQTYEVVCRIGHFCFLQNRPCGISKRTKILSIKLPCYLLSNKIILK